jgi:hypothetical protein
MAKTSPVGENIDIEALKKQVEDLTNLVAALTASKQEEPKKTRNVRLAKQEKSKELAPNTYVSIMSLLPNPLNLSTKPRGQGELFRLEKFGSTKRLFYSQLLQIIENHPNFFEKGFFYIMDKEVIEANNWNELYSKLLTKEMIESILNNSPDAIELFKTSGDGQRDVIVNFLIEKIVNGESVDFNLIAKMNDVAGIDINKMAQERKQANSAENK